MDNPNLVVVKSNKIIEASFKLSLSEQRIILACIAQIDSMDNITMQDKFEVSVQVIADLAGLEIKEGLYRDLKKAADGLFDRYVIINEPDTDSRIKKIKTRWISSIAYFKDEATIGITFAQDIIPYLSQITANFTKYKLAHITRFKSAHSIRLYELLCQWGSVGEREVRVDWLKERLQIGDKYKHIKDLKLRVIDVAVKEINEHSNLQVGYGQRKTGRKVTHFQFGFKLKTKAKQIKEKTYHGVTESEIKAKARIGESYLEAGKRIAELKRATKGK